MATANTPNVSEMFRQGVDTFEAAMKATAKMQEESARRFTDMLQEIGSPAQWQKRVQTLMTEAVSVTQNNLDQAVKVMNQNAAATMELFQKAIQTTPVQQGPDAEEKYRELWESALGTLRRNTETILQANSRVAESWADLARKVSGQAVEIMAGPENGQS